MVQPTRPPANAFVAFMRKAYNPIGFSKGYNFVLFVIFAGALMDFILARLQFLDINNVFCGVGFSRTNRAAPGECFYYRFGYERVGIIMHLACVLPASFLACFQFVPAIRHKVMLFHRINGYIIMLLSLVGTAGALMIARHSFGGGLAIQSAVGFAAIIFLGALLLAYINIKRLQIEQHRAWMLRAWFYAGAIVTARPIMFIAALVVTSAGNYYVAMPCNVIDFLTKNATRTLELYPTCGAFLSGQNPEQHAVVRAALSGGGSAAAAAAALQTGFGPAVWLALVIHLIGIEIYLHLTPIEAERLRHVSYQRQLEAGMRRPGSAGLTSDRLGDAEQWLPAQDRRDSSTKVQRTNRPKE